MSRAGTKGMVKVLEGEEKQFFIDALYALRGAGKVSFADIGELWHMPETVVVQYYNETQLALAKENEEFRREKRHLVNPIRELKDWTKIVKRWEKRVEETQGYSLRQKRLGKVEKCIEKHNKVLEELQKDRERTGWENL